MIFQLLSSKAFHSYIRINTLFNSLFKLRVVKSEMMMTINNNMCHNS